MSDLPRLAERFGLARASHANYGQPFWLFVLGSTALSVAMAWLFMNTRGSVGLTMLMHAAANETNRLVPTRAAASYFLWRLRAASGLGRRSPGREPFRRE